MKEGAVPKPDMLAGLQYVINELDRLRPAINRAIKYTKGSHTLDDIVAMVMQGRARLWTTDRSFLICERVEYPQQTVYHIFLAGGDLEELVSLHPEVSAAAKADGAVALTLTGRPGWQRALVKHGWEPTFVTLRKEL